MQNTDKPMDPRKTMLAVKHNGKEVGRIPATAPNAEAYITELVLHYREASVEYVHDENASFLAALHGRVN
jgi:hypothetical protein